MIDDQIDITQNVAILIKVLENCDGSVVVNMIGQCTVNNNSTIEKKSVRINKIDVAIVKDACKGTLGDAVAILLDSMEGESINKVDLIRRIALSIALDRHESKTQAAKYLGIGRTTFTEQCKKSGLLEEGN